jgi:hypothetical protein
MRAGFLRSGQVAAEIGADGFLPIPHGHGDCAAAIESLRGEGAQRLPHDRRAVGWLPSRARLPSAGTALRQLDDLRRSVVLLDAVAAHRREPDAIAEASKRRPKRRTRL